MILRESLKIFCTDPLVYPDKTLFLSAYEYLFRFFVPIFIAVD